MSLRINDNRKQKLTLCMCIKNEAVKIKETIDRVLDVVDYMVVGFDKDSNDGSKEIIELYKEKIPVETYTYTWEDDFSKMRNQCLRKVKTEWALMLDGHDYIREGKDIIKHILDNPDKFQNAGLVDAMMEDLPNSEGTKSAYMRPIMMKNNFPGQMGTVNGVHWELPIHNIISMDVKKRIMTKNIVLEHRQPPENFKKRKKQRKKMNITGLKRRISENPKDARSRFYLARTLEENEQFLEAVDTFEKYLDVSTFEEEKYHACFEAGTCLIKHLNKNKDKMKEDEKRELIERAKRLALRAGSFLVPRNDHLIFLGDIFLMIEMRPNVAEHFFRIASAYREPDLFLFIVREFYTWVPLQRLAYCYAEMNMHSEAINAIRRYLEYKPDDEKAYKLIKQIREKQNEIKI